MEVKDDSLDIDVGVIVGRFQVPALHSEHVDLIRTVKNRHKRVIIFIGLAETKVTKNNPLDYQMRRIMINEVFPDITDIHYIENHPSDHAWSKNLDSQISKALPGESKAVLYGSRDSFISHYHGKFPTKELIPTKIISGSELRKTVGHQKRASEDFRAGVIWATQNRYDTLYPTVDIAIFNEDRTRILLGMKNCDGGKVRFPGGFATKSSGEYEVDARRETAEELGIEVGDMEYVCSRNVEDWRYRGEKDGIRTILFATKYTFGVVTPGDDLDGARWYDVADLRKNLDDVVSGHRPLFEKLFVWLDKKSF
jgi:bifunctional NMN adenylyltransferase/nudix hydrolase